MYCLVFVYARYPSALACSLACTHSNKDLLESLLEINLLELGKLKSGVLDTNALFSVGVVAVEGLGAAVLLCCGAAVLLCCGAAVLVI